MNARDQLDTYLPESIRSQIEQRYYARVNEQARFERFIDDPEFVRHPLRHIALFSDHGVVHVRDVAHQILQVLDVVNGLLIPRRSPRRLDFFMKGYGVMVAYLHDIGMVDGSHFGRAMHPEFATQAVFDAEFDPIVETIWDENWGNIAWRLVNLVTNGALRQDPKLVLREMLSMAVCHSKSKVPIAVLNDPVLLRKTMQQTAATDLHVLYWQQNVAKAQARLIASRHAQEPPVEIAQLARALEKAETALAEEIDAADGAEHPEAMLRRHYHDFEHDSFQWLVSEEVEICHLVGDVVDTLRALRTADALRQRGTVLRTSGNYQIFVDQVTAHAIYALQERHDRLFLLMGANPLNAGEANLAGSELGRDGNLRVSFYHGAFADQETTERAAYNAAIVVDDVQSDVLESFQRPPAEDNDGECLKTCRDMQILIEGVDDNLEFAELVRQQLLRLNPQLQDQVRTLPSLQHVAEQERRRYLEADHLNWDMHRKQELLGRVGQTGHQVEGIDPSEGFNDVKLIALKAGEMLIEAGTRASFVYIPLEGGLMATPLGGYQMIPMRAWIPLGNTSVIRGATRNATVLTEQDVELLMIPKEVYLRYWHKLYTPEELLHKVAATRAGTDDR